MGVVGDVTLANDVAKRLWEALGTEQPPAVVESPGDATDAAVAAAARLVTVPHKAPPRASTPPPKAAGPIDAAQDEVVRCGASAHLIREATKAAMDMVASRAYGYVRKQFTFQDYTVRARAVSNGTVRLEIKHPQLVQATYRALSEREIKKITGDPPDMAICRNIAATALPGDARRLREIGASFDSKSGLLKVTDDDLHRREESEDDEGIDIGSGSRVRFRDERD